MKLTLLLVLAACFGQGNYLPEPAPIGTLGSKPVYRFVDLGGGTWRHSAFARLNDPMELELAPVRVAFANDGTVCPIPSSSPWWAVAKQGDNIPCLLGWRRLR